jgi:hypothetical protein
MSYAPYVTGNNQKKASSYGSGGTTTTGGFPSNSSPYGSNPYGAAPSAPATAISYNPYQTTYGSSPSAPAAATSNYNPYENVPKTTTSTTSSSSYNPYGAVPAPSSTTSPQLPDFSNALDAPPPINPASYGQTTSAPTVKRDPADVVAVATAYPVPGNAPPPHLGASMMSSTTYHGGPTNGLVSEGNPVKCHKVDYEIKGHEMQLVE